MKARRTAVAAAALLLFLAVGFQAGRRTTPPAPAPVAEVPIAPESAPRPHAPSLPPVPPPQARGETELRGGSLEELQADPLKKEGKCEIVRGNPPQTACYLYMKVNGQGYPEGTGCAEQHYMGKYGCSGPTEAVASCLYDRAVREGLCPAASRLGR